MNEDDAELWREHKIPAILLLNCQIKYGFCQLTHQQLSFCDAIDDENQIAQVSLHQIESMNISLIRITKLQIVREAGEVTQTEDFDYQASTFSQLLSVTPKSHERYFDRRLLMLFGSDPINTLDHLSGKAGENALEIVDELGHLFIVVSAREHIRMIANYVFAIVKYNKIFESANRLLPTVGWTYNMSEANVNFPLKLPISVEDYRHLKFDYCTRALANPRLMKHVDASIDNLIRCVCTGLSRRGSSEFKELFTARQSKLINSATLFMSLFGHLPQALQHSNIEVVYDFSNGQNIQCLLSCVNSNQQALQIGVAAFLNTDYRRASISCPADFSSHVLLIFKTSNGEILALLFDNLERNHSIYKSSVYFVNLTEKSSEAFEECSINSYQECIEVLEDDGTLIAHISPDLSEIVSSLLIFTGALRTNRTVTQITVMEAWRFIP